MLEQDYDKQVIVIRDAHLGLRDNPLALTRLKALAIKIMQKEEHRLIRHKPGYVWQQPQPLSLSLRYC